MCPGFDDLQSVGIWFGFQDRISLQRNGRAPSLAETGFYVYLLSESQGATGDPGWTISRTTAARTGGRRRSVRHLATVEAPRRATRNFCPNGDRGVLHTHQRRLLSVGRGVVLWSPPLVSRPTVPLSAAGSPLDSQLHG